MDSREPEQSRNLLEDQNARDEYQKLARLDWAMTKCKWCNKTTITKSPEDHAQNFLTAKAGNLVEKEVVEAIRLFCHVTAIHPTVSDSMFVQPRVAGTVVKADCSAMHKGQEVFIDVTFTSRFEKGKLQRDLINSVPTVEVRHEGKMDKYDQRVEMAPGRFIPMAIDSCGAMSKAMFKFFVDANEELGARRRVGWVERAMSGSPLKVNHEWRRAMEAISLAVCRANGLYAKVSQSGLFKGRDREEAVADAKAKAQEKKEKERIEREMMEFDELDLGDEFQDIW